MVDTIIEEEVKKDYNETSKRIMLLKERLNSVINEIGWEYEAFFQRHPELKE